MGLGMDCLYYYDRRDVSLNLWVENVTFVPRSPSRERVLSSPGQGADVVTVGQGAWKQQHLSDWDVSVSHVLTWEDQSRSFVVVVQFH